MLFDLRGRRRRLIQVVYASLAVLMGGGLVFFGIGGSGTGLFDAFDGGGAGGGGSNAFQERAEKLEARARRDPKDEQIQLDLARTWAQAAQTELESDPTTGQVTLTEEAIADYGKAADAWEKYLKLEKNPNPTGGILMARTYEALASSETSGPAAIADIESAAEAQRIFAEARPSQGSLSQLAIYLYLAGKTSEADRAAKQALAKSPDPAQRQVLKQRLDAAKKQGKQIAKELKKQAKAAAQGQPGQPGQNPLDSLGGGLGGGGAGAP